MPNASQPAATPPHAAAAPLPRARACSASVTAALSSASGGQRPAGKASGRTTWRARSHERRGQRAGGALGLAVAGRPRGDGQVRRRPRATA